MVTAGYPEGEQHDRADLGIPADQLNLLHVAHTALSNDVKKVLVIVQVLLE